MVGGHPRAVWSDRAVFRALAAPGTPATVAIYGDMGICPHNNVGNLLADCAAGRIEAIVHMGDHACVRQVPRLPCRPQGQSISDSRSTAPRRYDLGMGDDLHGDAYAPS